MKERPILFSAPMVRALLDGSKKQTRRVVKPKIAETLEWFGGKADADDDRELAELLGQRTEEKGLRVWCIDYPEEGSEVINSPYGQPGDRLWVRETFSEADMADGTPVVAYRAGGCIAIGRKDSRGPDYLIHDYSFSEPVHVDKWKPSIFMPRWASRITLEITGVRVERLQDISAADAMAEGIMAAGDGNGFQSERQAGITSATRYSYAALFEDINGTGSWDANPWVWVIEFKVLL